MATVYLLTVEQVSYYDPSGTSLFFRLNSIGSGSGSLHDRDIEGNRQRLRALLTKDYSGNINGVAVEPFEIKPIDLGTRRSITITADKLAPGQLPTAAASIAGRVSHVVLEDVKACPMWVVYAVESVDTHTLAGQSVTFSLRMDELGTMTLNQRAGGPGLDVSGTWDLYEKNLGGRCLPYSQPMVIHKSVRLPYYEPVTVTLTSTLQITRTVDFCFVSVTGIENGKFTTALAVCWPDEQAHTLRDGYIDIGPAGFSLAAGKIYRFPTISEIVNDPQTFTPFTTSGSIVSITISRRPVCEVAGFNLNTNVRAEGYINAQIETGSLKVVAEGERTTVVMMVSDNPLDLVHVMNVPSLELEPIIPEIGTIEVRDMTGSIVTEIDPRWIYGRYGQITNGETVTLSGLKLETAQGIASIESRLIFPDGSIAKWVEGTLPYNTSAYLDYVATQQRYDREMLSIANQKASADLIIGTTTSITNGIFTGAIGGGPMGGVASAAIGAVGNIAKFEIDRAAALQELEAKQQQLKLMPDNVFTSSTDMYLSYLRKNSTAVIDSVVVRVPSDAYNSAGEIDSSKYPDRFTRLGHFADGRMAVLSQKTGSIGGRTVKLREVITVSASVDRGDGGGVSPPMWLTTGLIARLRAGTKMVLIGGVTI